MKGLICTRFLDRPIVVFIIILFVKKSWWRLILASRNISPLSDVLHIIWSFLVVVFLTISFWTDHDLGLIQGSMHCVQTAYESLNALHHCLAELVLAQANVEQSWLFMILATFSTT